MSINSSWKRIFFISVFWIILGVVFLVFEILIIQSRGIEFNFNNFGITLTITIIASLLAGLLGGAVIVYLLNPWFSKYPFGRVLFYIFILFTLIFLFINLFVSIVMFIFFNGDNYSLFQFLETTFRGSLMWKNYLFWAIVNLFTIIGVFVSDKFGTGVFFKFLRGKYFRAKKEERIFMFLDLRSSISIAEKIGEEQYFNFFKQFIDDCTKPILNSKGEIYQYIGDEIIVTWEMEKGLENNRCIECFFEITKVINKRKLDYENKFDQVPQFKAGIHLGEVMVGEIGKVKRDIAYSGDVLNTTARIQGECNKNDVNLLISNKLLQRLDLNNEYAIQNIGEILLRGKSETIELHNVKMKI